MGQLRIRGEGAVFAKPDIAYVYATVVTEDKKVDKALQTNNEESAAILQLLAKSDVDQKDIQTVNFRAEPIYKENSYRIDHYCITNSFNIKVCDLNTLGVILSILSERENVRVQLNGFDNSQAKELLDEARTQALADAIRKAMLYTATAGISLKNIESIEEDCRSSLKRCSAVGFAGNYGNNVQANEGEQSHTASITVAFNIGDETPILIKPDN